MIVVYLLVLIGIVIFYIFKPAPDKKQECRIARAGDVNHLSPLVTKINDLSNKSFCFNGEIVNIRDYDIFVVDGESMANCGIHTGNGVLVSRLLDKKNIANGTIVIYEIDSERYMHDHPNMSEPQYGFKIRQLLGYAKLENSNDTILKNIKKIDEDLNEEFFKNALNSKLDKARDYFKNQNVTISITYKNGIKDYSIHSFSELYGVVKYIIPEEYIKNR